METPMPGRRVCFMSDIPGAGPCDGRLVRGHLIRRQVLRRELNASKKVLEDPRGWVWLCGGPCGVSGHHGMLDVARTVRIPQHRLPAEFVAWVTELGLEWWIAREYGEA